MELVNNIKTLGQSRLIAHAVIFIITICALSAQDIHYSQQFNTPLSLNPALTGKMEGSFRIGFDYRNQWLGLGSRKPYSTPSFYGDLPVRFKSKDVLGIGINIVSDKSSGGLLSSFSGMVSTAYHKALGGSKKHFFSFGLQLGFLQKKIDLANLQLGDQVDFPNGSTDFNNLKGSDGAFDMNVGFDWSSNFSDRAYMRMGYAVFHVTQPGISFYTEEEEIPVRHSFSFESDFGLAPHFRLMPLFIYNAQAESNEAYLGLSLGFPFTHDAGMYLGSYFRINDAVIPYFGLDIKGVRVGVSYDFTTSSLEDTGGSIEVSLIYVGRYVPVPDVKPSLYCPRF